MLKSLYGPKVRIFKAGLKKILSKNFSTNPSLNNTQKPILQNSQTPQNSKKHKVISYNNYM